MGSSGTRSQELIREMRDSIARPHEPLRSETRTVVKSGSTISINPTSYGLKTLDLSPGDDVTVETYRDFLVIKKGAADE